MRRNVGIAAIKNKEAAVAKYKSKGNEIAETNFNQLVKQFDSFKSYLEEFAVKHKDRIRKVPEFRSQFQSMCATIGVDPIASSKGFWAEMLGVGDFYYHLAIRVIEATMARADRTGGLVDLEELVTVLNDTRSSRETERITRDDVMRAVRAVRALGSGFAIVALAQGRQMVRSVPGELNIDQTSVLKLAQDRNGQVTVGTCATALGWTEERSREAVECLVKEGIAWVDGCTDGSDSNSTFWIPGLFSVVAKVLSLILNDSNSTFWIPRLFSVSK